MDGRRRVAEPVTDGASPRPASGAAPAPWRARTRFGRALRRRLGPFGRMRLPRGAGIAAASVFVLGAVAFGVVRGGHISAFAEELRDGRNALANTVGFRISTIALSGVHQLSGDDVLEAAGVTAHSSLLFLDATEVRTRLKANPWIAEANVLKLYPGRLNIAITERTAFALWQKDGQVSVIAADGAVVEPYTGARFSELPLVVGVGAAGKAKDFLALLDRYPELRQQTRASVLIAERRWNVVLKSGLELRLPETDAEQALDMLVQLDRNKQILSRDIAAIDLRLPDRVTVQLSDEAAAARAEAVKSKTAKKKAGAA